MRILILTLFLAPFAAAEVVTVEECEGNRKLRVDQISMWPLPMQFPGSLHTDVRGAITGHVRAPVTVEVKVYSRVTIGFFSAWVKFPLCIAGFGSCTIENGCDFLPPDCGLPSCTCPVPTGEFDIPFRDIYVPELPSFLHWVARRDYKVEVRSYESGRIITCHKVYINLDTD